ncbi:MAG TPA: ATP-binding protein, partial [Ectothiorhodospiraceae bacterium]|nr:ATP-binding protein [Ectothiorhodospiraceae bacterium]
MNINKGGISVPAGDFCPNAIIKRRNFDLGIQYLCASHFRELANQMKISDKKKELTIATSLLYNKCNLSDLSFTTTAELHEKIEHLGQSRAMAALKFGIGIKYEGYNLYVMGSTGLGKNKTVNKLLEEESASASTPPDWCYINNFEEYQKPLNLSLPAGKGRKLQRDMEQLIEDILIAIPSAFQGDEYRARLQKINDDLKEREAQSFAELDKKASENGVAMLRTPSGYTLGPEKEGHILTPPEFNALPESDQEEITRVIEEIEADLKQVMRMLPIWQKESREEVKKMNRELSQLTVEQFVEELKESYRELPEVLKFIARVEIDILDSAEEFRKIGEEKSAKGNNHEMIMSVFSRYQVNVLVDNSETEGAPVIYEDNPTYQNLVGHIDHIAQYGTLMTDFSLIKSGAIHCANGGYLVLDARKLLLSPFSWEGLKRAIHAREIRIDSLERLLSLASTTSLQPEPIPLDFKVVITGSRMLYYMLKQYDPEFGQLFKVAADFEEDMERDDESKHLYAQMIASLQRENELAAVERSGVARIIEHCARMVDDGEKLSLHMGSLLDLLREADYWSKEAGRKVINADDVQQVIDSRRIRLDRIHERVTEQVLRGIQLIDTSGEKVAQVNGLSVIQLGDYAFGHPVRITATARLGSGKVIDIEREVEMGGSIHSKGVMILSAYLANHYAKEQPLALSATLVFEQSYGMVEGDSASAAELCALLSALAGLPIKQGLAVTGSVNQHGEIQAIGGVNEKIEGFFEICNARKLTGDQGVIIPR